MLAFVSVSLLLVLVYEGIGYRFGSPITYLGWIIAVV
jgi:hypothetical protein